MIQTPGAFGAASNSRSRFPIRVMEPLVKPLFFLSLAMAAVPLAMLMFKFVQSMIEGDN